MLHEDAELLVLHKPAGLVCHPTKGDAWSSLVSRVRLHLGTEAEPQMVHRLDRETSGVMVFAKTAEAALELRRMWELGFVTKEYLALVHGEVRDPEGHIDLPLGTDETSAVAIKDCVRPDGVPARTHWWLERVFTRPEGTFSLLRVRLDTGRKHQIRIHLAAVGHPLVGDKIYGPDEELFLEFVACRLSDAGRQRLLLPHQALHAARLWIPWDGSEREFSSPPEPEFQQFLAGQPVPWPSTDEFGPHRTATSNTAGR